MKLPYLAAASLTLPLLLVACASPRNAAWHAYETGNYGQAAERWEELARAGDSDAQFLLGLVYDEGQLGEPNASEALHWYTLSAEQGHPAAQCNLGLCYYEGRGALRSHEVAALWFERAAAQGFAKAQNNLAVMHLLGQVPSSDPERARALLAQAAEGGDPKAAALLPKLAQLAPGATRDQVLTALAR
jgi:TPR repeat protein